MNYFSYLKYRFPFYIISGIILSVALCASILVYRYRAYLDSTIEELNRLSINKGRVVKEIKEVDSLAEHFRNTYPIEGGSASSDTFLYRTLDDIKAHLNEASIRVSGVKNEGGRRELPVDIELPVSDYPMMVDAVGYVEALAMPKYRITNITIARGQYGNFVLYLSGVLMMPSLGPET